MGATASGFVCTGCRRELDPATPLPFRCPDAGTGDDVDHVLTRRFDADAVRLLRQCAEVFGHLGPWRQKAVGPDLLPDDVFRRGNLLGGCDHAKRQQQRHATTGNQGFLHGSSTIDTSPLPGRSERVL